MLNLCCHTEGRTCEQEPQRGECIRKTKRKEDNIIKSFWQAASLQSCFGKKGLSWTIHSFEKARLASGEARITAQPRVANLDQRRRSCRWRCPMIRNHHRKSASKMHQKTLVGFLSIDQIKHPDPNEPHVKVKQFTHIQTKIWFASWTRDPMHQARGWL